MNARNARAESAFNANPTQYRYRKELRATAVGKGKRGEQSFAKSCLLIGYTQRYRGPESASSFSIIGSIKGEKSTLQHRQLLRRDSSAFQAHTKYKYPTIGHSVVRLWHCLRLLGSCLHERVPFRFGDGCRPGTGAGYRDPRPFRFTDVSRQPKLNMRSRPLRRRRGMS